MEPHIEPVDLIGMVPVTAHMDRRKGEGSMVSATKLLWEESLRRAGYIPRPAEVAALASGAGKFLVEGLPGTGKTFLAEVYARITSAVYVYHMCHSWSSDQEFFLRCGPHSECVHICIEIKSYNNVVPKTSSGHIS